jgi:S1-C subfamily serine protease
MMRIIIAGFAGWLAAIGGAVAQDVVPTEMVLRTWFIHPKGGKEAGSAFTLDYKGRIYLITARHVVEGVPATDAELEVRRSQADAWTDYHTMRTLYPSSADVDIAVFETGETVPQPYTITPGGRNDSDHDGMTFGQVVWFIGYPFGLSSLTQPGGPIPITSLPFAKRGSISAVDASHPDAVIDYIDGFNNKGFSGGPVVYWAFGSRSYKILSVVKGYRNEAAEMNLNGQMVYTNIMVNSGILVSYSITHAIDAIEKSLLSTK